MKITFTESAWNDYLWLQQNNRPLVKRVHQLVKDITRSPFDGIGKPEPLKGDLSGRCLAASTMNIDSYMR